MLYGGYISLVFDDLSLNNFSVVYVGRRTIQDITNEINSGFSDGNELAPSADCRRCVNLL
jgi:hypothetical protein